MKPINRYLLIEKRKIEEEKELVLLPEGYSKKKNDYEIVKVLDVAESCTSGIKTEQNVIVQSSMVEEINTGTNLYCLILENYVVGIL
tara:strand:- start:908 stop:1168 length:261 start_codon:yes stop_codon:yes gene_type:complete